MCALMYALLWGSESDTVAHARPSLCASSLALPPLDLQSLNEEDKRKDRAVAEVLLRYYLEEYATQPRIARMEVLRVDEELLALVRACPRIRPAKRRKDD